MNRSVSRGADHPVVWPVTVACGTDPDLFFSRKAADVHAAQRMCARCPMLARCASYTLASPATPTDGVFASVRLPVSGAIPPIREEAFDRLREVAATGEPAELHDFTPAKFSGTEEELREAVTELRDVEGLSWADIGHHLGCSYTTAQNAYHATTEAVA